MKEFFKSITDWDKAAKFLSYATCGTALAGFAWSAGNSGQREVPSAKNGFAFYKNNGRLLKKSNRY